MLTGAGGGHRRAVAEQLAGVAAGQHRAVRRGGDAGQPPPVPALKSAIVLGAIVVQVDEAVSRVLIQGSLPVHASRGDRAVRVHVDARHPEHAFRLRPPSSG